MCTTWRSVPWGDLYVSTYDGIYRFVFDASGNASAGVGINAFNTYEMVFSPWGELFTVPVESGVVHRFIFDGSHNAIANGTIPAFSAYGLGFSPWGELFVARNGTANLDRWRFDASRRAISAGTFSPGVTVGVSDVKFAERTLPGGSLAAAYSYTISTAGGYGGLT